MKRIACKRVVKVMDDVTGEGTLKELHNHIDIVKKCGHVGIHLYMPTSMLERVSLMLYIIFPLPSINLLLTAGIPLILTVMKSNCQFVNPYT